MAIPIEPRQFWRDKETEQEVITRGFEDGVVLFRNTDKREPIFRLPESAFRAQFERLYFPDDVDEAWRRFANEGDPEFVKHVARFDWLAEEYENKLKELRRLAIHKLGGATKEL